MEFIDKFIVWYNASGISILPKIRIKNLFEVIILAIIIYYCIKNLRGTRVWVLAKGVLLAVGLYFIAYIFSLTVILEVFRSILLFLGVAVIVSIQPELRKFIESLGINRLNKSIGAIIKSIFISNKSQVYYKLDDSTINEIVKGCFKMGNAKTGALIAIEGEIPLNEYIQSGISLDANVTEALLINIFEKNTPLHDGAVIIKDNKVKAATCYLPLSESNKISKELGTRHRAAIGLSEITDTIIIVVSEETGYISVAQNGVLKHNIDREGLVEELKSFKNSHQLKGLNIHKKSIVGNWPSTIISILIASILWIVVTNSANPVETITLKNMPITIINESIIDDLGKTYEVVSNSLVDIKLTDKKNVIDDITREDVVITADMSKLSITNSIPLDVSIVSYPSVEYTLSNNTLQIDIEDISTTEIGISVVVTEDESSSRIISDVKLSNDTVVISGAASIIETIGDVSVYIDQSSIEKSSRVELPLVVHDKNGNEINNKVSISTETVKAQVTLYNTKFIDLNIIAVITDPLVERLVKDTYYNNKQIMVAGTDEILSQVDAIDINIEINTSFEDIASKTLIKNISIQQYLPEGMYVGKDYSTENFTIELIDYYTNSITFNSSDIKLLYVPDGVSVEIEPAQYTVNLLSTSNNISDITVNELNPFINLSKYKVGTNEYTVEFRTYSNYVLNKITAVVSIVEEIDNDD